MVIRAKDRQQSKSVRFGGKGLVTMLPIISAGSDLFHNAASVYSEVLLKQGESFGVHSHTSNFEILFFLEGIANYYDDDKEYQVSPGDVCVCEKGHSHGVENASSQMVRYIALVLNPNDSDCK